MTHATTVTGTVLDDIVAGVRADLAEREAVLPRAQLEARLPDVPPALDAEEALRTAPGTAVIAEVKRVQPEQGRTSPPSPTRPRSRRRTRPAGPRRSACSPSNAGSAGAWRT